MKLDNVPLANHCYEAHSVGFQVSFSEIPSLPLMLIMSPSLEGLLWVAFDVGGWGGGGCFMFQNPKP